MNSSTLAQKLWNRCKILRDDVMSCGDYVEQLTYPLFRKMANERSRPPYHQSSPIPAPYAWPVLAKNGDALFDHYGYTLEELGNQPGTQALILAHAAGGDIRARYRAFAATRRFQ